MDIQIKATKYELTPDITTAARKKMEHLGRYLGKDAEHARAYVELGRAVGAQSTGDVWRAEVNVETNGETFRAESVKAKLDHALHTAAQDVAAALRRARKHDQDVFRRGGAAVKDFIRGFGK